MSINAIDNKEKPSWTVYVHTSPTNKNYVGITSMDPQKRWGYKGSGYKDQVFYNAIQKYGWDNFQHKIIAENLTAEEAKSLEISLIKELESHVSKNGYNVTLGGDGFLGVKRFGEDNSFYGKHHTEESKKKMREHHHDYKGSNGPFYGKHHTEESKKKLREAHLLKPGEHRCNYGRHTNSDERKKQIGLEHSVPIYQFDMDLNFISEYPNIKTASEKTGYTRRVISICLRGERKIDKDYIWVYKKDVPNIVEFQNTYKIKKKIVNKISVYQFDKEFNYISKYEDIVDAEAATGITKDLIKRSCNGEQFTSGGYVWRYKKDIGDLEEFIKINKNKNNKTSVRPIYHVINNSIVKKYKSINEAHLDLKIPYGRILKACKNMNKFKHEWFYADEYDNSLEMIFNDK